MFDDHEPSPVEIRRSFWAPIQINIAPNRLRASFELGSTDGGLPRLNSDPEDFRNKCRRDEVDIVLVAVNSHDSKLEDLVSLWGGRLDLYG